MHLGLNGIFLNALHLNFRCPKTLLLSILLPRTLSICQFVFFSQELSLSFPHFLVPNRLFAMTLHSSYLFSDSTVQHEKQQV